MRNKNIFCLRKGGATVGGKHFPISTSSILAKQLERQSRKMEKRRTK